MVLGLLSGGGYGPDHAAETPAGDRAEKRYDRSMDQLGESMDVYGAAALFSKSGATGDTAMKNGRDYRGKGGAVCLYNMKF